MSNTARTSEPTFTSGPSALAGVPRRPALAGAALLAGLAACAQPEQGGLTAHLEFSPNPSTGAPKGRAATARHPLRASALPEGIARLQVTALDVGGSTLAETNLTLTGEGPNRLQPLGGTWRLDRVPIGRDRQVVARAFLGTSTDPRLSGLELYRGSVSGVEVRSGQVTDTGTITLTLATDQRYPPLDFTPPASPSPVSASTVDTGEALAIDFTRPSEPDVAGYLVVMGRPDAVGRPELGRGAAFQVGEDLGNGYWVAYELNSPVPEVVSVGALMDGAAYTVLVYAWDADLDGLPLNYSSPAAVFGIPIDRSAPGPVTDLTATPGQSGAIDFGFTGPGEDADVGTPARYEVRASATRAAVEMAGSFAMLPALTPPAPKASGEPVRFSRTPMELGVSPADPFFLGVRAVDAAGNAGPIAVVAVAASTTAPPVLASVTPPIAIAGRTITLGGSGFGGSVGSVTLTSTSSTGATAPLAVNSWRDDEIVATVPATADSGTLAITRTDGRAASAFLAVVARIEGALPPYAAPFELLAADTTDGLVSALYREEVLLTSVQGAVERIYGVTAEALPLASFGSAARSTAIAGAYARAQGEFLFVASTSSVSMSAAIVGAARTASASAVRIATAVPTGGADHLALELVEGSGPALPAILAFSKDGTIYTATVADARTQPFSHPIARTTATASTSYDLAALRRNRAGEALLGYRALDLATGGQTLVLTVAAGAGFAELPAATRPELGEGFVLLSVPGATPSADRFVVVYEAIDPLFGLTEIRALDVDDYGLSAGYAPFEPVTTAPWRLEDVGLVWHFGEPWIAILATRLDLDLELHYTEIPLAATALGEGERGLYPGVLLDQGAPTTARGRVGCRTSPLAACPMVWMDDATDLLFLRR